MRRRVTGIVVGTVVPPLSTRRYAIFLIPPLMRVRVTIDAVLSRKHSYVNLDCMYTSSVHIGVKFR